MQFESTYTVRGVKLRMFRGGHGEPTLFLHGAAGLSHWTPFFETMSHGFDFIAIEHPGYGKSDSPEWISSIDELATFYLDVIEGLGVERVHLIGSSLGGWLASEIAVRNSALLRSLTLLGPAGLRRDDIPVPDMLSWTPQEVTRKAYFDQEIVERILSMDMTDEQKQMLAKNRASTARLGGPTGFFNPALEEQLRQLTTPSLVLWGDTDLICPTPYADVWSSALPRVRKVILPRCGHLPHFEQPEETARHIKAFLGEL
ncbi:alpha/beta fold hydrolase [Ottowia thiooxydans]|uniref:alpha/beta fold hydrolase n=1 Tax=Ottowia thiooxydans TaxID=219182 RepID=UPI000426FC3C|nr:alpha/beta fold hydrolase [Ottowia thiooxydans]